MSENVRLNYTEIVSAISTQFSTLFTELRTSQDAALQQLWTTIKPIVDAGVFIEDEQMFVKRKDLNSNSIYIVVKFGSASTNFGVSVTSVSCIVWGQGNKIKPTQTLLGAFVSRFSTQNLNNNALIQQIWITPTVVNNFNNSGNEFRSLFTLNGTLVIGSETIVLGTIDYYWGDLTGQVETVPFLAFQDNFSNKLSPQPFGNTQGMTKSESDFFTYSFSINTYLLNNHLCRDCLALRGFRYHAGTATPVAEYVSTKGPNDVFKMVLKYRIGNTSDYYSNEVSTTDPAYNELMKSFKCVSSAIGQKIGDFPSINISFSH